MSRRGIRRRKREKRLLKRRRGKNGRGRRERGRKVSLSISAAAAVEAAAKLFQVGSSWEKLPLSASLSSGEANFIYVRERVGVELRR